MSQFAFLEPEFALVFDHARKAEGAAIADPRAACFYARLALETAIKWMYDHDRGLRSPYDEALSALIHEPTFRTLVGHALGSPGFQGVAFLFKSILCRPPCVATCTGGTAEIANV